MPNKWIFPYEKIIVWIILLVIVGNLGKYIIENYYSFTRRFDPYYYGQLYSRSQYVLGSLSRGGIGDDGLYAFAGYYYLFQGGDVSAVNFEHPPLGKYLIGFSIYLFRNENIVNLIYYACLLLFIYKIGLRLLNNKLLSLISVLFYTIDPLFLDHLIRSQLDLPFTLFLTAGIYFYLLGNQNSLFFYLSSLFFGAAFSTRFFPFLIIIVVYLSILVFFYQRKYLFTYIKSLFFIPFIYLICHFMFFIYHPSLMEFLRHKKWMLFWYKGAPAIMGNIWRNIFTGYYLDSMGKLTKNIYWIPLIPTNVILALTGWRNKYFKKKYFDLLAVYGLCVLFLINITILSSGVQKFLMPIYPLLIVMAFRHLSTLVYSIINTWMRHTHNG